MHRSRVQRRSLCPSQKLLMENNAIEIVDFFFTKYARLTNGTNAQEKATVAWVVMRGFASTNILRCGYGISFDSSILRQEEHYLIKTECGKKRNRCQISIDFSPILQNKTPNLKPKSATIVLLLPRISKLAFQSDSRTQNLSPAVLTGNAHVHAPEIHHVSCAAALPLQFLFFNNTSHSYTILIFDFQSA